MNKKILFLFGLVLVLIVPGSLMAGNFYTRFSFEAQSLNGDGEYRIPTSTYGDPFGIDRYPQTLEAMNFSVTGDLVGLNTGLAWDNKQLYGLSGTIGYRFSRRFSADLTYSYYFKKDGSQVYSSTGSYRDTEFKQSIFRLMGQYYLNRAFFVEAGVEHIRMSLFDFTDYNQENTSLGDILYEGDDYTYGMVVGVGFKRFFSHKFEWVSTVDYSFASYEGTELYQLLNGELDFDVGGVRMKTGLSYNL